MDTVIVPKDWQVENAIILIPAVTIILPFEPKMDCEIRLQGLLDATMDNIEQQLLENYPDYIACLIMQKIKAIVRHLNFNTHKKSIAIYVSPFFEKLLYLDFEVQQFVTIKDGFRIRDLVNFKIKETKYWVLELGSKASFIYEGNAGSLTKIISNSPGSFYAHEKTSMEGMLFKAQHKSIELILESFLRHIDNSLGNLLHGNEAPVFVVGNPTIINQFRHLTKYGNQINEWVKSDCGSITQEKLKELVAPFIAGWKAVGQQNTLAKLQKASLAGKLVWGIKNVWSQALHHKGSLLVVEENYMYPAQHGSSIDEVICNAIGSDNTFSYVKDVVDDVIEKLLLDGGGVEFVEEGLLEAYQHIAFIQQ